MVLAVDHQEFSSLEKYTARGTSLTFEGDAWPEIAITGLACHGATFKVDIDKAPGMTPLQGNVLALGALGLTGPATATIMKVPLWDVEYAKERLNGVAREPEPETDPEAVFALTIHRSFISKVLSLQSDPALPPWNAYPHCEDIMIQGVAAGKSSLAIAKDVRAIRASGVYVSGDMVSYRLSRLREAHSIDSRHGLVLFGHAKGILTSDPETPDQKTD